MKKFSLLATLLLSVRLPRTFAQGVNVAVPGFSQVFNLGRDNDKEIQDRWWFWVVIAFIAALFVVLSFFAWRGWAKWRSHKRLKSAEEAEKTASQRIAALKLPSVTSSPPTLPPMHPKSENKEAGGLGRVSVELVDLEIGRWKDGKESKEWVPRYGVDWREVERRTGGGHQRRGSEGRGERRGSLGGVGDINGGKSTSTAEHKEDGVV